MFDMSASWWEVPVRVTLVYVALLVLVRLTGKRTLGQSTPFDLLVILLLSETVTDALAGGDHSVSAGILAAGTLIALHAVAALLSARSNLWQRTLEGHAVMIGRDGKLFSAVLANHLVTSTTWSVRCELPTVSCRK